MAPTTTASKNGSSTSYHAGELDLWSPSSLVPNKPRRFETFRGLLSRAEKPRLGCTSRSRASVPSQLRTQRGKSRGLPYEAAGSSNDRHAQRPDRGVEGDSHDRGFAQKIASSGKVERQHILRSLYRNGLSIASTIGWLISCVFFRILVVYSAAWPVLGNRHRFPDCIHASLVLRPSSFSPIL